MKIVRTLAEDLEIMTYNPTYLSVNTFGRFKYIIKLIKSLQNLEIKRQTTNKII